MLKNLPYILVIEKSGKIDEKVVGRVEPLALTVVAAIIGENKYPAINYLSTSVSLFSMNIGHCVGF